MDEFKKFIKALGLLMAIMVAIIASVGAINVGSIYAVAGVCNFGCLYFPIREIVKYFKNRDAAKVPEKGGVKQDKTESKNNTYSDKV